MICLAAAVIFAMYVANAEANGVERARLGGTLQNDILKEYQAQKEYIARETRAKLRSGEGGGEGYTKTWEISGMPFRITMRGA